MLARRLVLLLTGLGVASALAAGPASTSDAATMRAVSGLSPFPEGCGMDQEAVGAARRARDSEVEPHVAVNPRDPRNIVTAWMQDYLQGLVVATTRDRGRTWRQVVIEGTSLCSGGDYEGVVDPWLAFDAEGTAYLSSFSLDAPDGAPVPVPFRTRWEVRRSEDGGLTWSEPVQLARGELHAYDRPAIVADPDAPGVVYALGILMPMPPPDALIGDAPGTLAVAFLRSEDGGRSWTLPRLLHVTERPIDTTQIEVRPDGSVVAFAGIVHRGAERPYRIVAWRSEDRGESWSGAIAVNDVGAAGCCTFKDPETGTPIVAQDNYITAAAPDGALYVTYRDPQVPGGEASVIRVSRSTDGGRTWSHSDVRALPRLAFLPTMAVAGNGTLGVAWYDLRRDVPGGELSTELWFASSRDRGATWTERRLAGPFDLATAMQRLIPINGLFLGDYHGMDGLPAGFALTSAVAQPLAAGGPSDVFFARIRSRRGRR
jgi:hypothetical protein